MKKEGSEVNVDPVVAEVSTKVEVQNPRLLMEIVDPITRRRPMTITKKKRIKVMNKSKEIEGETEDTKKLMKTLITTSISMVLDLNMKES